MLPGCEDMARRRHEAVKTWRACSQPKPSNETLIFSVYIFTPSPPSLESISSWQSAFHRTLKLPRA
eukprot:347300-Chlamydomonas_euryale.AAC.1